MSTLHDALTRAFGGYDPDNLTDNPHPLPEGNHPVLDELINVGGMRGTTIRQMRMMAAPKVGSSNPVEGGLAIAVMYLVDRIEEMTSE